MSVLKKGLPMSVGVNGNLRVPDKVFFVDFCLVELMQ